MKKLIFLSIVGYGVWNYFNPNIVTTTRNQVVPEKTISATPSTARIITSTFSCDGRQHCSQMSSYEEAVYFNNNCPNTKMDGDHDGKPCERQFGY